MESPCLKCFTHGITYSAENCKDCEFNVVVKILKEVILQMDHCFLCKHSTPVRGGFYNCDEEDISCENHSMFEVDYDKVIKEYNIKL